MPNQPLYGDRQPRYYHRAQGSNSSCHSDSEYAAVVFRNGQLEQEIKDQRLANEGLNNSNTRLRMEIDGLTRVHQDLDRRYLSSKDKRARLEEQNAELERKVAELEKRNRRLESDNSKLQKQNDRLLMAVGQSSSVDAYRQHPQPAPPPPPPANVMMGSVEHLSERFERGTAGLGRRPSTREQSRYIKEYPPQASSRTSRHSRRNSVSAVDALPFAEEDGNYHPHPLY